MTGHHADKESKAKPTHKQQPEGSASPNFDSGNLLDLQRVVGNQAVQRLMAEGKLAVGSNVLQAKLTVGAPGDVYEQEADSVAQQVMTMPDTVQREAAFDEEVPPLQAKGVQREAVFDDEEPPLQAKHIQRDLAAFDDDDPALQMKSSEGGIPEVTDDIESGIEGSRGSGQAIPDAAREFFEPRFGQDFSSVNIHTGGEADSLNRSLEARAFTTGSDIYFREGEYNPESAGGRELLAHELTHVVQQGGSVQQKPEDTGQ
jgi:hypothetical protein